MTDRNLSRIQLAALAIFLEQSVDNAVRAGTATVRGVALAVAVTIAVTLVWKIRRYRQRYPREV